MWLEAELACLVPLQPGVSFVLKNLCDPRELGAVHNEFSGAKDLRMLLEFDFNGTQTHLNNADAENHGDELRVRWEEL